MTRTRILLGAALAGVLVVGAAGAWWFLRDDAPDAVSLSSAVDSVTTTTDPDQGDDDSTDDDDADGGDSGEEGVEAGDPVPAGVEGTWTVDAESGDFDYESATGTFVGFRVAENLSGIGSTEAVGRTGAVSGAITIEGTILTEASFEADLSALTTNESRRDRRVHEALDTGQFPIATFVLAEPVDLGPAADEAGPVAATATGELTVHGVTNPVQVPIEAQLVGDTIVVVASVAITFADYDVQVPTAPIVLSADDHGILELQILLTRT